MRILVSNDDGFFTPGIKALAKALERIGEVWVVAPDREQSAASHSLTLHRPLRVGVHRKKDRVFFVDGTPTDCVNIGVNKVLPSKPDIVVSGINRGANLGDDVSYSGTVAAALEGALLGIPAIAVSAIPLVRPPEEGGEYRYEAAADFAADLAEKVLKHGLVPGTVLNVNVPSDAEVGERRCEITRTGKRIYSDIVEEKLDPRGKPYFWIGGSSVESELGDTSEGTDCLSAHKGRISISPVQLDMTDHEFFSKLQAWKLPTY